MLNKDFRIESQALRDSAEGEECTFAIPGVCNGDPARVVLCHLPDNSHGMSRKADDISAAYGCSDCHDAIDGKTNYFLNYDDQTAARADREWFMRRAQTRTERRMIEKGVLKIA
jgi:hypothetical protein